MTGARPLVPRGVAVLIGLGAALHSARRDMTCDRCSARFFARNSDPATALASTLGEVARRSRTSQSGQGAMPNPLPRLHLRLLRSPRNGWVSLIASSNLPEPPRHEGRTRRRRWPRPWARSRRGGTSRPGQRAMSNPLPGLHLRLLWFATNGWVSSIASFGDVQNAASDAHAHSDNKGTLLRDPPMNSGGSCRRLTCLFDTPVESCE